MTKKILHIVNYYQDGMGYQENWLAAAQAKQGHQVKIVTSDYYYPFPNYEATVKSVLGIRYVGEKTYFENGVEIQRLKSKFSSLESANYIYLKLSDAINQFKPDVIHLHGIMGLNLFPVLFAKKRNKFKLFIDAHEANELLSQSLFSKLSFVAWKFIYKYASKYVCAYLPITLSTEKFLTEKLGISKEKIQLSPLGVDLNSMSFDADIRMNKRKELGVEEDSFVIIYAGKQYPEKKVDLVIEIFNRLKLIASSPQKLYLILLGQPDGAFGDFLNEIGSINNDFIIKLPLQKRDALRDFYCASDIGIWPGAPSNTIQEGMACGLSLVLPNDLLVGHLIEGNGIKSKFDTSKEINEVVNYLAELFENRDKLARTKECSLNISKKYSWERISLDLLSIYRNRNE